MQKWVFGCVALSFRHLRAYIYVTGDGAGHLTGQRIYLSISILDILRWRFPSGPGKSRGNLPKSLNQPGKNSP